MVKKKSLSKGDFEKFVDRVSETLTDKDVYGVLSRASDSGYRMDEREVKIARAMEDTLETYSYLATEMANIYGIKKNSEDKEYTTEKNKFENTFALYAGCVKGLEAISAMYEIPEGDATISIRNIHDAQDALEDFSYKFGKAMSSVISERKTLKQREILEGKESTKDDGNLNCAASFLKQVSNWCLSKKDDYSDFLEYLDGVELEIGGTVFKGYDTSSASLSGGVRKFGDVEFDDVIGNDDAIDTFKEITDDLLAYDVDTGINPVKAVKEMPRTVLVWGRPGTGKTHTLKATANYLFERADEIEKKTGKRKPVEVVTIDQKIFSKWVGESEENLRQEFKKVMNPDTIGFIYIEDIDGIMGDRSQMNQEHSKSMFTQMLNLIQGVDTEDAGNYTIFVTTNRPEGLDGALYQRLKENLVHLDGPQTEQARIDLLRHHLKKGLDKYIFMEDKEWEEFGKVAQEADFVGRDIEKLSKNIFGLSKKKKMTPEERDSIYQMDPKEAEEFLLNKLEKIDGKTILEKTRDYIEQDQFNQERGDREKFDKMVEDLLLNERVKEAAFQRYKEEMVGDRSQWEDIADMVKGVQGALKAEFGLLGEKIDDEESYKMLIDKEYYDEQLKDAKERYDKKKKGAKGE